MSLSQFINTISLIYHHDNLNKFHSIFKHLSWQLRKLFNLFPYRQKFSESIIIAENKYNGVSALINCMGAYDYNNMNLIKLLLKQGGVFFDIGANIGSYTLIASEQTNAKVYSFEAHPKTFLSLQKNISLNNRHNVEAFNLAVSETDGTIYFSDLIQTPVNHIVDYNGKNSIPVVSTRLDTFINGKNVVPDYIKIDVEGFEFNVLLSIGRYRDLIKIFFVEHNPQFQKNSISNLLGEKFASPLSFNAGNLTFGQWADNHPEDCIYILKTYKDELAKMNFNFRD